MTLDDFFTLTEMNNGLTAPSRVKELMAMMQKERDCDVKTAADSTRQRSAVASVLSSTENKECLDLFLQLDGLHYISNWLKDAQTSSKDTNDIFLEEHITHLLQALEKLNVDCEKIIASEIRTVVEDFLDYNSRQVQDKAEALLESWKTKGGSDDAFPLVVDKAGSLTDDEAKDIIGCSDSSLNNIVHEITRDDKVLSTSSDVVLSHDQIENTTHESKKISDEKPLDHHVSLPSSPKDFHAQGSNQSEDVTEPSPRKNSSEGLSRVDSDEEDEGFCAIDANQYRDSSDSIPKEGGGDINHCSLPESSKTISWGNFLSGISNFVKTNDLADNHSPAKKLTDREEYDRATKRPDVEIDYGIVDPLEVARQVAMEVEREIVDYRENSFSSTEKLPGSNKSSRRVDSPDSVSGKNSKSPMNKAEEKSSSSNESSTSSENPNTDGTQDVATSQVTEAAVAQEEANTMEEKVARNFFDLNQEVTMLDDCGDADAHLENQFSSAVSVVSASRATPSASKPPGGPLEFEGNLGWKGTARTSAFRPASPRRAAPEGERKLDFDLNVSESIDESSAEANSKITGLLELDLNRTSEDSSGGPVLDWRIGSFYPQQSPPVQQPTTRGIDLNDRPSFFANVSSDNNSSYIISKSSQNQNLCDPAISLMGKKVEIEQRDFFATQTMPSHQNGRNSGAGFDYNMGRMGNFIGIGPAVPYAHSPVYGYSNVPPGPTMPFSGQVYGPGPHSIPYMMGSASGLPAASFSQTPFLVNMNGPAMAPNGVEPSRSNYDLNSGMFSESGSRDPSGLGLFLNSTNVRPVEGPTPPQGTMGSSFGAKRKEPENGYNDQYYPFKHFMPHWKQS
ncbi:Transcription elongation factor (TFIIS) family protein [Striga hermonthica]|uniref:Transcription elongation factor (TFIIS) family protein n=1 Tax=Striga hermonthica TaxID=68872 RepID=A0A9N7P0X6_STRHE|nr:Transcription elongation factor (TFIIS) family protein [Striga hermonthica]